MGEPVDFNPDRVAALETAGWKAYAARNWPAFVAAMTRANQEEFGIPFPLSLLGSFYLLRAAASWVPANHDEKKVGRFLEKYYRLVHRYSGFSFEPPRAAYQELRYWDIHRKATGQEDRSEFVGALIDLHSHVFGITPEQALESAELRVEANNVYDPIAMGQKQGTPEEWREVESLLQRCYRSVKRAMQPERVGSAETP